MNDPEVDFWLDPDLTLFFSIRCPKCKVVHEHRADDLPMGGEIRCSSGAVREIGDPDFVKIQRQLREME